MLFNKITHRNGKSHGTELYLVNFYKLLVQNIINGNNIQNIQKLTKMCYSMDIEDSKNGWNKKLFVILFCFYI